MRNELEKQKNKNKKLKNQIEAEQKENEDIKMEFDSKRGSAKIRTGEITKLRQVLANKSKDFNNLQREYNKYIVQIKNLVENIKELARKEQAKTNNNENINVVIDELYKERDELLFRMNKLNEKYKDYIQDAAKEREDKIFTSNNHAKLLNSSIIFSYLVKARRNNLRYAISSIRQLGSRKDGLRTCVLIMSKLKSKYPRKLLGYAFSKWRHTAIDWHKERYINGVLIDVRYCNHQKYKWFSKWLNEFRKCSNKLDVQFEISQRILVLAELQERKSMRIAFNKWKNYSEAKSKCYKSFQNSLLKLNRKYKEAAFTKWLVCAGYIREALKAQQLINVVATDSFLRQMFNRFRHNLRIFQDEKTVNMNLQLDLS